MDKVIDWLLVSDPWVEYRTRIDLLGQSEENNEVLRAKENILAHPLINQLLCELGGWPGEAFASHKSAGLLMHKLSFLAEVGLKADVPEIKDIIAKIHEHTYCGIPQVKGNIPKHYGGTGEDVFGWSLCDAPNILYALLCFDNNDELAKQGLGKLKALARENGWPCAVSPELGTFRGPGKKGDPCPYATLIMLKALAAAEETESEQSHAGVRCLLGLWERSREEHPYIFYMGTDFRKLKAPFVWYDIMHAADVLSRFNSYKSDPRLIDMAEIIKSKVDSGGRYTAESEWKAWKGFEFAQKKEPSAWLTFLAMRILNRLE